MEEDKKIRAKITEVHTETRIERSIELPIYEGYVDMKLPERFRYNNGDFITVFQKALKNIVMFGNLTKNEAILLLYLIGSASQNNSVNIDLKILSEDLQMKKSNVSTALKGLVCRNIILRKNGYRYGNQPLPMELTLNYDQINYNVAYNGKIKNFQRNRREHPRITETDGMTLLEDHRKGQPFRQLQGDGTLLLISSNEEILE